MTTTTVVTREWTLEKYSRSRSSSSPAGPIEWDHYSQPELVVRLDATYDSKLPPAATLTARTAPPAAAPATALAPLPTKLLFQVTYDPLYRDRDHAPLNATTSTTTVTLDSIDFVRFSSREYRHATPSDQLPLKAVYRDSILGIRYLALPPPPPPPQGANSALPPLQQQQQPRLGEFRRVQLKFESTRDRESFVDAIRELVPVKPAAEPAGAVATSTSSSGPKKKPPKRAAGSESATPAPASKKLRKKKTNETQQQQQFTDPAQGSADPYYPATVGLRPTANSSQYIATPPSQPLHARNTVAGPSQAPAINITSGEPDPHLASTGSWFPPVSRQQQQQTPLQLPQGLASLLPSLVTSSSRATALSSTPIALAPAYPSSEQTAAATAGSRPYRTASLALAALAPNDLDQVLRETLFEEGFDEFVHRVKETLVQR